MIIIIFFGELLTAFYGVWWFFVVLVLVREFIMQCVDGFAKLADMGIEGLLNVLVIVSEQTYMQIVCQFTFQEEDIAELDKDEIISGCVGAALNGEPYHRQSNLHIYKNVVKHVPFFLISADGYLSSTWFTCLRIKEIHIESVVMKLLEFIKLITPRIKAVSLTSLDSDIREFVETFLHDENKDHDDHICECIHCGLPAWNGEHFECGSS